MVTLPRDIIRVKESATKTTERCPSISGENMVYEMKFTL